MEKREAGTEHWSKALTHTVPDTEVTLNDLNDNTEYEFRIRAQNKAGESEPSLASLPVRITEFPDGRKPEFVKKISDQEANIGGSVTYKVEFDGKPEPHVKWFKNGIELSSGNRYDIESEPFFSTLVIKQLTENENNQPVTCTIINPIGKESCEALIKIIG